MGLSRNMLYITVLGLFSLSLVSAQWTTEEDDSCNTPEGKTGTCVSIKGCKFITDILKAAPKPLSQQVINLLQSYSCGFDGKKPKVCCPMTTTTPTAPPQPPDVTNHRNINLINRNNCGPILSDRIVGGNKTSPFEYPWMALLAYNTNNGLDFRCGGSLIHERYILTAAHCITNLDPSLKLAGVRVGEHDFNKEKDCVPIDETGEEECAAPVQDFTISEVIPHPNFQRSNIQNDIGLLRLSAPANFKVDNVKPICLPTGKLATTNLVGKNVRVAGWGTTETGFKSSDLLQISLPVMENNECQERYNQTRVQPPVQIRHTQMCAGGVPGKDSCSGDSGGPLKYMGLINRDSRYVQYGIVSFGPQFCGNNLQPGVYTRVAYYMDWILDNIKP